MDYKVGDLIWYRCTAYEITEVSPALGRFRLRLANVETGKGVQYASPGCRGWGCRTEAELAAQPTMSELLHGKG